MIEFMSTSIKISLNYNQYNAIANLHSFQFTVAHALGITAATSRLLATNLNTEASTSNHYEMFMFILVLVLSTELNSALI
jgi:hypothetical protein